uniref:Uncharacterized protein n=1 Tax=Tanacetum cinerariifolium TaxID=118510 RepID=A0A699HUM3_TANCI|nr:hypothetical protein [Tanacetum cinerariifolium]
MVDKARGRDKTFNWETATYGEVYCEDLDSFIDFETDFPAIVNDASTSNQNVSYKPNVSIYNAIKSDFGFHISFSDSEDEDYTFIYNKDSSFYKLIPVNDLKSEPVNEHVEINNESCLENIDINPMDSVICASNETTPIEFDENIETNHDTPGVICEDMLKGAYFEAKTKTFKDFSILTNTSYSEKEIRRISTTSSQENAYQEFPVRRINLSIYAVSMMITMQRYEDICILGMYIVLIINFARTLRDIP